MKRYGNLFDKLVSIDNLCLADERARKGKTATQGVISFDQNREKYLQELCENLKNGTYKPSRYATFKIKEPKERVIYCLPYYPDRIVHHAIMNVVAPIWLQRFDRDTYCGIPGRGIQAAADRVRHFMRKDPEGCRYCLKFDIRKFYPTVDHDVLKQLVRWKIKDRKVIALIDDLIDSTEAGIPIGNHPSIFFALLYFTKFIIWLKQEKGVKYMVDYADDIVIFSSDKAWLRALLADIEEYLDKELKLSVKQNKQIFPVAKTHRDKHGRGVDFLGYVFYLHETRLRKRVKQNFARAVARMRRRPISKAYFLQRCASWWGWCKHSNSTYFINKLNSIAPYEIKFRR
jgi:hypothetical protein